MHKNNLKYITDLNIRSEIIKLLKQNMYSAFFDIVYVIFFGYIFSGKGNKSKNKQMGLHQTQKLLHSKGNYQQNEGKIFSNNISDKELISKVYEEIIQLNNNNKKTNQSTEKWEDRNRHITKKDIDGQRTHEKMLKTTNQGNENHTHSNTVRYLLTPVRIVVIKKTTNNKCW